MPVLQGLLKIDGFSLNLTNIFYATLFRWSGNLCILLSLKMQISQPGILCWSTDFPEVQALNIIRFIRKWMLSLYSSCHSSFSQLWCSLLIQSGLRVISIALQIAILITELWESHLCAVWRSESGEWRLESWQLSPTRICLDLCSIIDTWGCQCHYSFKWGRHQAASAPRQQSRLGERVEG